jgi:hypothetical protein
MSLLTAKMIIVVMVATILYATTLLRADLLKSFSSFSLSPSFPAEEELTFLHSVTSSVERTLTLEDIAYAEKKSVSQSRVHSIKLLDLQGGCTFT